MKKAFFAVALLWVTSIPLSAQAPRLLGLCTRDSLMQAPYAEWYHKQYDGYEADAAALLRMDGLEGRSLTIEVFFGTWCGDTQRELPRLLKVLDHLGWEAHRVKYIAVNSGEQYKQAPGGETVGRGIYRVPTFIVMEQGKEIGRIVEHPVRSLEADLADILTGTPYKPNFHAYPVIDRLLADGSLTHPNTSLKGLAKSLKPLVMAPSELRACGYVLMAQQKLPEAAAVFFINQYIFYEQADTYLALAHCLHKDGKHGEAMATLQKALPLNKDEGTWQRALDLYYEARKASE